MSFKALESGAVEVLIVWENLDIVRYVLKTPSGEKNVLFLRPEQAKEKAHFIHRETGAELEVEESMVLLEWFANNYKNFGTNLQIVPEGSQFCKGFGGIGGPSPLSSRPLPLSKCSLLSYVSCATGWSWPRSTSTRTTTTSRRALFICY